MVLNNISTQTLLALSKAIESEVKTRQAVMPGNYNINDTVSLCVNGTLTKCEDEVYTPTIKIAHKVAMALLVRHCGITGKAALTALENAMKMALEADDKSEEYISAMADIESAENRLKESLEALPKAVRSGKTLIKVKVE